MGIKIKKIACELKHHIPFTALATASAVLLVIFVYYIFKKSISEEIFHAFHFLHIIASAMVTAGIFYKYKPWFLHAFLIGISGAIIIGSMSDVVFPYLGSIFLGLKTHFHLPLVEETLPVIFSAIIGSLMGISFKMTKFPHFAHVFLSVFASLFYLLVFSLSFSANYFAISFVIVFFAVIIPCCLSDIIFPFFFLPREKNRENKRIV